MDRSITYWPNRALSLVDQSDFPFLDLSLIPGNDRFWLIDVQAIAWKRSAIEGQKRTLKVQRPLRVHEGQQ